MRRNAADGFKFCADGEIEHALALRQGVPHALEKLAAEVIHQRRKREAGNTPDEHIGVNETVS